jgi:hypothetical protein
LYRFAYYRINLGYYWIFFVINFIEFIDDINYFFLFLYQIVQSLSNEKIIVEKSYIGNFYTIIFLYRLTGSLLSDFFVASKKIGFDKIIAIQNLAINIVVLSVNGRVSALIYQIISKSVKPMSVIVRASSFHWLQI